MKKIVLLLLILMTNTIFVFAQSGVLQGSIMSNSKGIGFSSITIEGEKLKMGIHTNDNGNFKISLNPGKYTLTARALGYSTEKRIVQISAHLTTTENFNLKEDVLGLEQVVVSGTKREIPLYQSPVIVHKINTKTLSLSPSMALSESLNFSPGLRMETNCQNCGFNQLRMNGLDGAYSQILVNSRPVFSALVGVYGLEMIPSNMIERIEVINGSGSAQYGGNAIGGTVNIITQNPTKNQFQAGSNLSFIGGKTPDATIFANGSIVNEKLNKGASFFAYNRNRSAFDANNDGFSEIPLLQNNSFGTNFFWNTSDRSKLTFNLNSITENRRGGNKFDLQPHEADIAESLQHRILGADASFDIFSDNFDHKFSIYTSVQNANRNSYYGSGGFVAHSIHDINDISIENKSYNISDIQKEILSLNQEFDEDAVNQWIENKIHSVNHNKIEAYSSEILRKSEYFTALNSYGKSQDISSVLGGQYAFNINPYANLLAGSEFLYNKVDDYTGSQRSIHQSVKTIGNFLQVEFNLKPISLLLGTRYDHALLNGIYHFTNSKHTVNHTFNNIVPRVSLKYDISKKWSFRTSYAQGYRIAQAFDEDLHIASVGGSTLFVKIDPNLKSETSDNLTASFNYIKNSGDWQANFMIEGFYTQLHNAFKFKRTDNQQNNLGVIIKEKTNVNGATTVKGVHLEVNYAYLDEWILQLGGTYQTSRYQNQEIIFQSEEKAISSSKILRTPDLYGFMSVTYNPASNLSFTISNVFTGSMDVFHEAKEELISTPTFIETNVKGSYKWNFQDGFFVELSAGVQNIFNSYQRDFDTGIERDSNYIYGPAKPITSFLGLKIGM